MNTVLMGKRTIQAVNSTTSNSFTGVNKHLGLAQLDTHKKKQQNDK